MVRPPTLECGEKEANNTAIHSGRVAGLFLVEYVKWTPLSHLLPGGHGEDLEARAGVLSVKVQDTAVRLYTKIERRGEKLSYGEPKPGQLSLNGGVHGL